ncbi:hypothetical protein DSOL_3119 [Desulfosporosinus metallidurans]|uniref:Uncharacterized protein n=1 Tax=Desulfosporosinus metallidurans TaxID=1888891 RepID=A0A1Q8QSN1_9FIRM|nr:hypothetical protein DSOL_3119 [Desulfosporosinus metallidurans]
MALDNSKDRAIIGGIHGVKAYHEVRDTKKIAFQMARE